MPHWASVDRRIPTISSVRAVVCRLHGGGDRPTRTFFTRSEVCLRFARPIFDAFLS